MKRFAPMGAREGEENSHNQGKFNTEVDGQK